MESQSASGEHVSEGTVEEASVDDPQLDGIHVHPTIKPLLIKSALLALGSLLVISYLFADPQALGNRDMTEIGILVVALLAAIGVIRYFIQMLILRCTVYGITERTVWRDFELLRRKKRREVPYEMLRSCELNQGRIEATLGYGTISMNQGLGTLKLVNVENPQRLFETIQSRMAD